MKEIKAYIQADQAGQLERSAVPLKMHAVCGTGVSPQERLDYFYGMTTMFPLMFLGHYYQWLSDGRGKDFQAEFFPGTEQAYGPYNRKLMERIYAAPDSYEVWLSSVSGYLSCYPYALLEDFAQWAFPEDLAQKAKAFLAREREEQLILLLDRLTQCREEEARVQTVLWLGTQYPYELLLRFHNSLFGA